MFALLVSCGLVGLALSNGIVDCGSTIFKDNAISLGPDPLVLPGNLEVNIDAELLAELQNLNMEMTISKKTSFGDIKVPCLFNVGSCKYENMCDDFLGRMEKENWLGLSAGIAQQLRPQMGSLAGQSCPLQPQTLNTKVSVKLPELPSVFKTFANGDYKIRIALTGNGDEKLGCFETDLQVKSEKTGWLFG